MTRTLLDAAAWLIVGGVFGLICKEQFRQQRERARGKKYGQSLTRKMYSAGMRRDSENPQVKPMQNPQNREMPVREAASNHAPALPGLQ